MLPEFLDVAATGLVHNSRDLRYLFVNAAYAKLVGRPVAEIVGRALAEVLGERALAKIRPHVERVLRGERVEYELSCLSKVSSRAGYMLCIRPNATARVKLSVGWV